MAIDPGQLASSVATGLMLGIYKVADALAKRRRNSSQSRQQRQLDRLESKVDRVVEDVGELQHRQSRVEDRLDIQPSVRRVNGVPR